MGTAIQITFPHRQFAGTPWDKAVLSGTTEWPPSPWRLLRALLSVWYTKHPEVRVGAVDRIIEALRVPPEIRLPDSRPGHTRHYMPVAGHRSAEPKTSLILAPYRSVHPTDPVVFWWPTTSLDAEAQAALEALVGDLTYFGRAESVCRAQVKDHAPTDGFWMTPMEDGPARVLMPELTASRTQLSLGVAEMRKNRLNLPEGGRWVSYSDAPREEVTAPGPIRSAARRPTMIRWRLTSRAPIPTTNGLLLTNALRDSRVYRGMHTYCDELRLLSGHVERENNVVLEHTRHAQAHWLWMDGLAAGGDGRQFVTDLLLYLPGGMSETVLTRAINGKKGRSEGNREIAPEGAAAARDFPYRSQLPFYEDTPSGYVPSPMQLIGVGQEAAIAEEWGWGGESMHWRSATPYLVTLHPKKHTGFSEPFVTRDFNRQWSQRYGPDALPPIVSLADPPGRRASEYRRFRPQKRERPLRFPVWLELKFPRPVAAPMPLGDLAHFGFGVFEAGDGA